ncbi:MAG: coenzyme-B sulfoethylthiotransferase subunit beta [Candidatus Helarchaeota archaeon]
MKYKDKVDLYDSRNNCLASDIPIEALSPLHNSYIQKVLDFVKRTAIVNLGKLQNIMKKGTVGVMTSVKQDECKVMHTLDLPLVQDAPEIAERVKKLISVPNYNGAPDDTEVFLCGNNQIMLVKMPKVRMNLAAGRDVVYTYSGQILAQVLSEMYDITPDANPDYCGLIKTALYGRYPQTVQFAPGNVIGGFLKPPQIQEGIGIGYRLTTINNIVALTNKITLDAVALCSILEQGAQLETGNAAGWYERYCLLGLVYQGFNANNIVMEIVAENKSGTVGDVIRSIMERAINDGIIKQKGEKYPDILFSGYKLFTPLDPSKWNAYNCAGLLAACIVNVGASRAAQCVSAVLGAYPDLIAFESGGLPDPDFGRIMGTGLGFCFYTHSIYGGAGPGAFSLEHVLVRHTSGFFTPCVAAAMCLDAGTQVFSPEVTSGSMFKIKEVKDIFLNPLPKIAAAAEEIKPNIK